MRQRHVNDPMVLEVLRQGSFRSASTWGPRVGFFDLIAQVRDVREVLECFESHKSWMLRSVDQSAPEGERMMKYKTMLERRLLSTMGELLELQKYKT